MIVIVQFRRSTGKLIGIDRFCDEDFWPSLDRLAELDRQNAEPQDVEVVRLTSQSEAMLARTHGNYFSEYAMSNLQTDVVNAE